MRLFYSRDSNSQLVGYADAGFLFDPHKGRSQTDIYLHVEILLFHENLSSKYLLLLL
jgi:hypothetical protein